MDRPVRRWDAHLDWTRPRTECSAAGAAAQSGRSPRQRPRRRRGRPREPDERCARLSPRRRSDPRRRTQPVTGRRELHTAPPAARRRHRQRNAAGRKRREHAHRPAGRLDPRRCWACIRSCRVSPGDRALALEDRVRLLRWTAVAVLVLLAAILAVAAHDALSWRSALSRGDARLNSGSAAARWRASTLLPGDPTRTVLALGDDLA